MYNPITSFSNKKYPVVICDIPWKYYGNPNKDQGAGKHYPCIEDEEVYKLPVSNVLEESSILFIWTTSPKLHITFRAIEAWGLHYRGIAFHWIKTTKAGKPINGQGARPSLIKYAGEMVLWASFHEKGRPLPIKSEGTHSLILDEEDYIFEPRPQNVHSRKPETIQNRIEELLDGPYLEIFARRRRWGWDCFGNQIDINEPLKRYQKEMKMTVKQFDNYQKEFPFFIK